MRPSSTALIVGLVLVAVVFHLSVVRQDLPTLAKNGYLYDDAFYAFQIARNLAEGAGPTFDGTHITNGFQPLYVMLLVPIFYVFGASTTVPIYAALTLLALCTAGTALLLFLIARRYVTEHVAWISAAIWVVSPIVIRQAANGLETALALFMLASSVYYYLDRVRSNPNAGPRQLLTLGALLGLALLARVDQVFLVFAIALDYLWRARHAKDARPPLVRNFALALSAMLVVYSPWLIFSLMLTGTPLQQSGSAIRLLSIAYAPFFNMGTSEQLANGPGLNFVWTHIVHSFSVLKAAPPVHLFFRATERLGAAVGLQGALHVVSNVFGLAVLGLVLVRSATGRRRQELQFLLLFSAMVLAAYCCYVFGVFFFDRYYYPIFFVLTLCAAFLFQDLANWARGLRPTLRMAAIALTVCYGGGLLYMGFVSAYRSGVVSYYYDVAQWVGENTAEDETIGVFQGGAIGYFSNRRVINLDGKVNMEALEALKQGRLKSYVAEERIDVVLDNTHVMNLFLGSIGDGDSDGTVKILDGIRDGLPGWVGFRLDTGKTIRAGAARAGAAPASTIPNSPAEPTASTHNDSR